MKEERARLTALIMLPQFYNPDAQGRRKRVGAVKFRRTCSEITHRFGGCTLHKDPKVGYWQKAGIIFEDGVLLLEVDIPDTGESRQWLIDYARRVLLRRFEQQAIYLKFVRFIELEIIEARG